MTYVPARPRRLDLEAFARAARMHPDLTKRLVRLGLVEAEADVRGVLWFAPEELAVVARIQRLRTGFALNYAAVGLVLDLLGRIAELETALRRQNRGSGGRSWTRTV